MSWRHIVLLFILVCVLVEIVDPSTPFVRTAATQSLEHHSNSDVDDETDHSDDPILVSSASHAAVALDCVLLEIEIAEADYISIEDMLINQHSPQLLKRPPIA